MHVMKRSADASVFIRTEMQVTQNEVIHIPAPKRLCPCVVSVSVSSALRFDERRVTQAAFTNFLALHTIRRMDGERWVSSQRGWTE